VAPEHRYICDVCGIHYDHGHSPQHCSRTCVWRSPDAPDADERDLYDYDYAEAVTVSIDCEAVFRTTLDGRPELDGLLFRPYADCLPIHVMPEVLSDNEQRRLEQEETERREREAEDEAHPMRDSDEYQPVAEREE
jgi:hypothetical protein